MEMQKKTVSGKKIFATIVMLTAAIAMVAAFFLPFVTPRWWLLIPGVSLKWLFGNNYFIAVMDIVIVLGTISTILCVFAESHVQMAVVGAVPGISAMIVAYAITQGTINELFVSPDHQYGFGIALYVYIGSMLVMAVTQIIVNWKEIKCFSRTKAFLPWVLTFTSLLVMFLAYFMPMLNAKQAAIGNVGPEAIQLLTYDLFNEGVVFTVETTTILVPMTVLTCIATVSGFAFLFLKKWGLLIAAGVVSTVSIVLAVIKFCTIPVFFNQYNFGIAFYVYLITTVLLIVSTCWLRKTYEETI